MSCLLYKLVDKVANGGIVTAVAAITRVAPAAAAAYASSSIEQPQTRKSSNHRCNLANKTS